jgi:diphosphomevalonate decarboxylase
MSESLKFNHTSGAASGKVTWQCPSNIALVKYWGKQEGQLPSNPSLSMALTLSYTETSIEYEFIETLTSPEIHFSFEGSKESLFEKKIKMFIQNRVEDIPILAQLRMNIQSHNTFPHSAGIASSASAFGALALCLCSIEKDVTGSVSGKYDFYRKASFIARLGSGSASRSMYGGYAVWGENYDISGSSDLFGVSYPFEIHPLLKDLHDSILVVSSAKKTVSSSAGHELMIYHPYAESRYLQARKNLSRLVRVLQAGDLDSFVKIVENEALSLHALMMSSSDSFILLKPFTLSIIEKAKDYRLHSGIPVCFTLDAGPNIHLIYPDVYKGYIQDFIQSELTPFCEAGRVIHDSIGKGPEQLF